MDRNHDLRFGLIINIPNVVGIIIRGHSCECGIYLQLIIIYIHIKKLYGWVI